MGPLKSAVDAGCADLVFVMLEAGMDPDEADVRCVTALHDAAFAGRADICRILLDGRAKVNTCDRHGQTPLFFAGTTNICMLLCDCQADVNIVNSKGQTALHLAGRAGLRDVVEFLLKRCSKEVSNLQDIYGATAQQYLMISSPGAEDAAVEPAFSASARVRTGRARRSQSERRWRHSRSSSRRSFNRANDDSAEGSRLDPSVATGRGSKGMHAVESGARTMGRSTPVPKPSPDEKMLHASAAHTSTPGKMDEDRDTDHVGSIHADDLLPDNAF